MSCPFLRLVGCLIVALLMGGCGQAPSVSDSEATSGNQDGERIQRVDASTLQWDENERQGRLDGLRVEVTAPQHWNMAPYDPNHVAAFTQAGSLPRIVMDAEFSPLADLDHVDEENLLQFASEMKNELAQQNKQVRDELVIPMVIGERPCVRYDTGGRIGGKVVDRQILVTHVHGRRYVIELRARIGELDKHRTAAYAVLAGMRFTSPQDPPPTTGESEPAAENEPAVESEPSATASP